MHGQISIVFMIEDIGHSRIEAERRKLSHEHIVSARRLPRRFAVVTRLSKTAEVLETHQIVFNDATRRLGCLAIVLRFSRRHRVRIHTPGIIKPRFHIIGGRIHFLKFFGQFVAKRAKLLLNFINRHRRTRTVDIIIQITLTRKYRRSNGDLDKTVEKTKVTRRIRRTKF